MAKQGKFDEAMQISLRLTDLDEKQLEQHEEVTKAVEHMEHVRKRMWEDGGSLAGALRRIGRAQETSSERGWEAET